MLKVYIAGKLRDTVPDYIANLGRMIEHSIKVRQRGYAVFVPGLDVLLGIKSKRKITYRQYFENSFAFLEACDAVYVVPKSENSEGVKREIKHAKKLGIPVFYNIDDMCQYFEWEGDDK